MEPVSRQDNARTLPVFGGPDAEQDLIGTLQCAANGEPLTFEYADTWLAREDAFPLSPLLAPERFATLDTDQQAAALHAFLAGLLPSGQPLASLAAGLHLFPEDIGVILGRGGGLDTAGALRFGRPTTPAAHDPFGADTPREVALNELARRIAWRDTHSLSVWDDKVHALLPGGREKVALHIVGGRRSLVVADRMASTHIVKIGGTEGTCSSLSSNELFMMRLAAACGVAVPNLSLERLECGPVLCVQRFDRPRRPRGNSIHRLHMVSGWQLLGLPPQSGISDTPTRQSWLTGLLRALRTHATDPHAETLELLRRVAWQVLTGSCNMDPGNLAFFVEASGALRLAPAFALRTLWPFERAEGFPTRELALPVAGRADPLTVDAAAWSRLAGDADLPADKVIDMVRRLARQLPGRITVAGRQSLAESADARVVETLSEGVRVVCQAATIALGDQS